jgi:aminoglycoside phosphotransferase (APT) family kinase protein
VPAVLAVCDDESVVGAPFYVMERMDGHVVTSAVPAGLDTAAERRRMVEELVDGLVELHAIDWRAAGLEGFGRPDGYLERQVRRFLGVWEHNKTREIGAVERVAAWLRDNRIGNVMYAPDAPARMIAIFDWEMSTIGDPLADVGYLTATYTDREDPPGGLFELSPVTRGDGFLLRDELVARYEERSGRTMQDIRWYQTLAIWKAIVFMEGNYKRAISGASDDPFLKSFGDGVVQLAERAEELTRGA